MPESQPVSKTVSAGELVPQPLTDLGLAQAELTALRKQGSVSRDLRGDKSCVYKLRFRESGKQRVVYLGVDAAYATEVNRALDQWQQPSRSAGVRAQAIQAAGQTLRRIKHQLAGPLEAAGYYFHGRAPRKRRKPPSPSPSKS